MNKETIKKILVTASEKAELVEEAVDLGPPAPNEVIGDTLVSLISPGTELAAVYKGGKYPAAPGYAAVFRVRKIGETVDGLSPGDIVFCMGKHQSIQSHEAANVVKLPEGLAPEKAAFARMMGISMTTLTTTSARPPATVFVTGLGLVGHLAALIFQSCGYDTTGFDPLESRREKAKAAGIRKVVDSLRIDDPEFSEKAALVVECSGHEQTILSGCRIAKKGGEVVMVGVPWERRTNVAAHDLLHAIFHRYVVLRSGWEWELPRYPADFTRGSIFENFAGAMRWLNEERINVEGIAAKMHPSEAQQAYQSLLRREGDHLTVLFDWR